MRSALGVTKSKFILTTICLLGFNSSSYISRGSELKSSGVKASTSFAGTVSPFGGDNYHYYMEHRLREDFSSLFQLGQEITRESQPSLGIENYRQVSRSEEHTSELQSLTNLVCRLLLEKK